MLRKLLEYRPGIPRYRAAAKTSSPIERKISRLIVLVLVMLALIPRLMTLDQVATVDEPAPWYPRTVRFLQALQSGNFATTYQIGHPGVTTMWLGSLGLLTQRFLAGYGLLVDTDRLIQLAVLRTPTALVSGLAVVVGYLLLRRLFRPQVALLAGLLWATDPLLVAHSRVFHLDALLSSFMTLSLLALLAYWREPNRRWLLIGSGVAAGLAVLTKVPSVVLLPMALLTSVAALWRDKGNNEQRVRLLVSALLIWGLSALTTVVLLWPALWVAPVDTARKMLEAVRIEAGEGHSNGNFFMGQPDPEPGPLFYPVAMVLRLSPWALVGLLLLPLAASEGRSPSNSRSGMRRDLALLAAFVLSFMLLVTLSPKKFDRYLLPAFPALNILAAAGLGVLIQPPALRILMPAALGVLAGGTLWWYEPNYLAYYNPLLGGGATAQQVLPVGWGEGIDEARAWLNGLPNAEAITVASRSNALLGPRARFAIVSFDDVPAKPADFPNYLLLYISNVQRQRLTSNVHYYYEHATPAHVVRLHGVEYAFIYQIPPPVPHALVADFGTAVRLRGYAIHTPVLRAGESLRLALFWEGHEVPPADYLLFVHLIGPDGQRYAQVDLPPGGAVNPTSTWHAGRYYITGLELPIPAAAPVGRYRVMLGLYNPADGNRLPFSGAPAADAALAGAHALELGAWPLQISPP